VAKQTQDEWVKPMMNIDIQNRINNIKLGYTRCLAPVFEAIINSIHAIQEAKVSNGIIDITLERATEGVLGKDWATQPITGFVIQDNGIGFTDEHFRSFQTSDTTYKAKTGGKGIGRLLWLKAFTKAEIESTFKQGGKFKKRTFEFTYSADGVEKDAVADADIKTQTTRVRLSGFRPKYQAKCQKSIQILARKIIEHCLEYFVQDNCPKITLHDCADDDTIVLNDHFKSEVLVKRESQTFDLKKFPFRIDHILVNASSETEHCLHFCANLRSVKSEGVLNRIPNLQKTVLDQSTGKTVTYMGYVSGQYLDERVMSERTEFAISDDPSELFGDEIAWSDLVQQGVDEAKRFLSPFTDPVAKAKIEQIRTFVQTKAPEYRPVVKHCPELLDPVPSGLNDEKLDLELYKIGQVYDARLRHRYQELLADGDKKAEAIAERKKKLETFMQEWNEAGMSKLARHVAHRKATLGFLEQQIGLQDNEKYALEERVHEVIFPLRCTSDDVRPNDMNLWILDERLSYHYYLASDKKFSQVDAVEVDSEKRVDLLIFNNPFAFAELTAPAYGSIVIVEFKRPERDDYTDEENPITQVYGYVRDIKAGKVKDRHGKTLTLPPSLPFYAYIVCDLTAKLKLQAENHDFTIRPDAQGYVQFNKTLGLYTEIISFAALIDHAKKKNARFFDELGLGRE
jgi:hypothetical protein